MNENNDPLLGHIVNMNGVCPVRRSNAGDQYFIENGERIVGNHLKPGQTWRIDDNRVDTRDADFLLRLAYHESGHAAACFSIGIRVEYVSIVPQFASSPGDALIPPPPLSGCCRADYAFEADPSNDPIKLLKRIGVLLGGGTAEAIFAERRGQVAVNGFWAKDQKDIKKLSKGIPKEKLDSLKTALQMHFEANWRRIESVAEAMLKERAIEGERAQRLFGEAPLDFDF